MAKLWDGGEEAEGPLGCLGIFHQVIKAAVKIGIFHLHLTLAAAFFKFIRRVGRVKDAYPISLKTAGYHKVCHMGK